MSDFCAKCGAELSETMEVCPFCDTRRDAAMTDSTSPGTTPSGSGKPGNPPRRKKLSIFHMVVSVFNTLFGGFFLILFLFLMVRDNNWKGFEYLFLFAPFPIFGILCIVSQLSPNRVLSKWMKAINILLFLLALFFIFFLIMLINALRNFT